MKKGLEQSYTEAKNAIQPIIDKINELMLTTPKGYTTLSYIDKIIKLGLKNWHKHEMSVKKGFVKYLKYQESKALSDHTIRDLKYLSSKLLVIDWFANSNFSDLTPALIKTALKEAFAKKSQYNKAIVMLHGFFAFAVKKNWLDNNTVNKVKRKD